MALFKLNRDDSGNIKSVEELMECPGCSNKISKNNYECPFCEWEFAMST